MALIYPVQADAPEPDDGTEPDFGELAADLSDTWLVEVAVEEDGDDAWVYPGHGKDTTIGVERPSLPEWRARGW